MNAYELWYEFLRRADLKTWTDDDVRNDFGEALHMGFEDWFEKVKYDLFAPYGPITGNGAWIRAQPVRGLREGESTDLINFNTHLVLVIDRSQPLSTLMKRIEMRVKLAVADDWNETVDSPITEKKEGRRKSGQRNWKPSLARYPFKHRPNVKKLKIVLFTHDTERDHPDWQLWKVGLHVKKQFAEVLPNMKIAAGEDPNGAQKAVLTASMGRIMARAKKIKAGVVKGIFPATQ